MNDKKSAQAKAPGSKLGVVGITGPGETVLSKPWTIAQTTLIDRLGASTFHLRSGDSIRLFKDGTIHFRSSPDRKNIQIVNAQTGKRLPWLQTGVNADALVAGLDRGKMLRLVENAELDRKQKTRFLDRLRANLPSIEYLAKVLQIGAAVAAIAHHVVDMVIHLHNAAAAAGITI